VLGDDQDRAPEVRVEEGRRGDQKLATKGFVSVHLGIIGVGEATVSGNRDRAARVGAEDAGCAPVNRRENRSTKRLEAQ
jgi:hypothetical protein